MAAAGKATAGAFMSRGCALWGKEGGGKQGVGDPCCWIVGMDYPAIVTCKLDSDLKPRYTSYKTCSTSLWCN